MSNYVVTTDFTAKDALAPGHPSKVIKGTEFGTEFAALAVAIATKADLASPTLTGTPLAPTAAVDTNTTQLATTAFVIGQGYAKLASPTFTGTPAAPTAAVDTNTTQLATTAFVVGQGYLKSATAASTYAPLVNPVWSTGSAKFSVSGGVWTYNYAGGGASGIVYFSEDGSRYLFNNAGSFTLSHQLTVSGALSSTGQFSTSAGANIVGGANVLTGTGGTYYVYSYGAVYAEGEVYAYYSDERLKERIAPLTNALDKLATLDTFTYRQSALGKELVGQEDKVRVGVSAQQVQAVLPEAVGLAAFDLGEDGASKSGENYLTVQYDKLVPLLIAAVNELRAEVAALKAAR